MSRRSILTSGITLLVVSLTMLFLSIISLLTMGHGGTAAASDSSAFLYTVATRYEPLAGMHGGYRFPSSATIFLRDSTGKRPLVAEFAASADTAVSFDGQRVLFAGRRTNQNAWQIWEVSLAGGEARRVTSGSEAWVRPFYLD